MIQSLLCIGMLCGICYYFIPKKTLENFWSIPNMTSRVQKVIQTKNGTTFSIPGVYNTNSKVIPNIGYKTDTNSKVVPNIGYKTDTNPIQSNPILYDKLSGSDNELKEKYKKDYKNFINPSQKERITKKEEYTNPLDLLPVSDMKSVNANCDIKYPIIYDRHMFANQKSRLYQNGDPIRGDLPIQPIETGWFRPAANPHVDLHKGALSALGGIENETSRQLMYLSAHNKGSKYIAGSGINAQVNNDMYLDKYGDVNVSRSQPISLLNNTQTCK